MLVSLISYISTKFIKKLDAVVELTEVQLWENDEAFCSVRIDVVAPNPNKGNHTKYLWHPIMTPKNKVHTCIKNKQTKNLQTK